MSLLPPLDPLELPPGDPAAIAEIVDAATGAAFRLGVLGAHLAGPAAGAPGWLGADAAEAAAQIATVTDLVGRMHAALGEPLARLAAHADVLAHTRARVLALREAQQEDVARVGLVIATATDAAAESAAIAQLVEAEAARGRVHAALLVEVADDAAATAGVLARSAAPVGGGARRGDGARVTATLAALLPGWGEPELAALGSAAGLAARTSSTDDVTEQLAGDDALLGNASYAAAWLAAIGPDGFRTLLRLVGQARERSGLSVSLAALVRAAFPVAAGGLGNARLQRVLDEPLRDALEADVAVGLGRLATCGLPPSYLARIVEVLVDGERAQPNLRSEELEVAAGDDPVAAVLGALADSGDADTAAGLLASADLWPQLLGRTWTVGLGQLERLIALASDGERADLTVRVLLQAVGAVTDVVVTQVSTGSPEAFTLMSLSPVIGTLVGEHLRAVTETVAVGLGVDGVPARPLTTDERRLLAGLGMVTLDPAARSTVLRALVRATADAPPAVGSGAQPVAAYVHGGVFAAIAFGEAQEIRQRLYSAVAVAENRELCWGVVTAPLGWINLRRVRRVFEVASTSTAFYGPGGVPLEDFLRQPATGHDQAAFSAVVASMPGLVANELLPDPGSALDHGLGSRAGARYEVALVGQEREIWDDIVRGAEVGFLHVGGALGIVPGSGAAPR